MLKSLLKMDLISDVPCFLAVENYMKTTLL
jgi:hypothetical protein